MSFLNRALIAFPDIDPALIRFELFGREIAIFWYAIAYIAGFILCLIWARFLIRKPALFPNNTAPISKEQFDDLLTWGIVGVILGGRLGYVLFYQPGVYADDPWAILRLWEGGMAFHGGFVGAIIAGLIFSLRKGLNPWSIGDLVASGTFFGLFFGRIANFINAELWGRPTDVPWAVAFPGQAAQECGQAFGELCGRHPSQLYEAGLEGLLMFVITVILIFKFKVFKKRGVMFGVFFLGYGLARVFVEGFRQADAQFITADNPLGHIIRLGEAGLTMGQLLSLPMVLLGLVLVLWRWRAA
ncbi:MAG: prolipoprotein diacylglyceryl transferase [Pseudomonadota bacterium]